jgi:hypothetical protein
VGFESTIPKLEQTKTINVLDRAAAVIGRAVKIAKMTKCITARTRRKTAAPQWHNFMELSLS